MRVIKHILALLIIACAILLAPSANAQLINPKILSCPEILDRATKIVAFNGLPVAKQYFISIVAALEGNYVVSKEAIQLDTQQETDFWQSLKTFKADSQVALVSRDDVIYFTEDQRTVAIKDQKDKAEKTLTITNGSDTQSYILTAKDYEPYGKPQKFARMVELFSRLNRDYIIEQAYVDGDAKKLRDAFVVVRPSSIAMYVGSNQGQAEADDFIVDFSHKSIVDDPKSVIDVRESLKGFEIYLQSQQQLASGVLNVSDQIKFVVEPDGSRALTITKGYLDVNSSDEVYKLPLQPRPKLTDDQAQQNYRSYFEFLKKLKTFEVVSVRKDGQLLIQPILKLTIYDNSANIQIIATHPSDGKPDLFHNYLEARPIQRLLRVPIYQFNENYFRVEGNQNQSNQYRYTLQLTDGSSVDQKRLTLVSVYNGAHVFHEKYDIELRAKAPAADVQLTTPVAPKETLKLSPNVAEREKIAVSIEDMKATIRKLNSLNLAYDMTILPDGGIWLENGPRSLKISGSRRYGFLAVLDQRSQPIETIWLGIAPEYLNAHMQLSIEDTDDPLEKIFVFKGRAVPFSVRVRLKRKPVWQRVEAWFYN